MKIIYTDQSSKLTKKQKAVRERILREQREIKRELKQIQARCGSSTTVSYRRDTVHYPSLNSGIGSATMKNVPMYTGDAMIGIGQLHKSNAVPVFKQEEAEDLARMRR